MDEKFINEIKQNQQEYMVERLSNSKICLDIGKKTELIKTKKLKQRKIKYLEFWNKSIKERI